MRMVLIISSPIVLSGRITGQAPVEPQRDGRNETFKPPPKSLPGLENQATTQSRRHPQAERPPLVQPHTADLSARLKPVCWLL